MKAKSKVLLGLLVALAMMVLAVPAFAATTTFSIALTPSKDEGLVVYQGNTGKINVAITEDEANADADDVYEVTAKDVSTGMTTTIADATMTLNGEAPSGNLKMVTGSTTDIGKHKIDITVTKTAGKGQGAQTVSSYIVDVRENLGAKLSTENLTEDATLHVYKRSLNTGDTAEISVTREKGSESDYTYQWQIAKAGADAKTIAAAAYDDPTDKVFEDIAGETGATLQKTVDIDDNGKYVRCIVTDGDGNRAIASAVLADKATTVCCVRLDVTDKNLVCASPTEDQDVSVIMTQTKDLEVVAKAGTKGEVADGYQADGYKYVWKKDGVGLDGGEDFIDGAANTATLTIKPGTEKDAEGDYVCEIEDGAHQKVTSPVFHVTVADMPVLTLDPSVVTDKAEYDKNTGKQKKSGDDLIGSGDTFIATANADQPLDLKAVIENPADIESVQWLTSTDGTNFTSQLQGESTTFQVASPSTIKAVKAIVKFKDIPDNPLEYTTNVYVTDGSLSGNVYTYIGNTAEKAEKDPEYVVTLPAGVYWKTGADTAYAKNTVLAQTGAATPLFEINLPAATNVAAGYQAVVTEAPTVGERTLSFKLQPNGVTYPQPVLAPYVKNMTVKIPNTYLTDKHDGSTQTVTMQQVVLPVSDGVGYKIVRTAAAADLKLKKTTTPYNTKEQPAEVIAAGDTKIGEVSEVRYMSYTAAKAAGYVKDGATAGKVEMETLDAAKTKAFLAALSSDAPVDKDKYIVVCNVAASDELEAAENLLVPDVYEITAANNNAVEKDPTTFFDWTKQKVYNGEDQEADVKFVDGMEKKGKISKVTYKTVDSKGALVTVQPNAVGKYRIYVSTERDPEEVDSQANVGTLDEAYIGDFEITKLPVTADLFKMNPTEADYTGNPIVPEITTETAGVGEIEAVHYFAEGSEEELGSAPVKAGVYTVKIDVKEGENYRAEKGVEVGTLTIKSQETNKPTLYMRGHVQNKGWDAELAEVKPGSENMIGTTGSALRVEAIDIVVPEGYTVGGFAHVQNEGDVQVKEVPADAVDYPAGVPEGYKVYRFGSTGKGQRLEAIQTEIKDASGALLEGLSYQVHVENKAWMGYVANGSFAGTRALGLRLEALRFAYEGTPAPTEPETPAEPEKPAEETPATPETPAETPETPAV